MLEPRRFTGTKRRDAKAVSPAEKRRPAAKLRQDSTLSLSSDFWSHFVENYWSQRPCVFKQVFAAPPITLEDAFRAAVAVGEQYRIDEKNVRVRFYVENAWQQADVGKHLPEASDLSLDGYAERMKRKLRGRRFGLVINEFQKQDAALYLRLRDFLHGLYELTDVPANAADAVLFLGNYKSTPFGLHYDAAGSHNFTFVLAGRKRLLTWPLKFFGNRQEMVQSLDYERYRDEATVLEGGPGDLLYWPSDYWHVAEACDPLPITLAVGHFRAPQTASADPLRLVARLLDMRLRASGIMEHYSYNRHDCQQNASQAEGILARTTEVLRDLSRDEQLERLLRVSWLNRITGFGFDCVPPPLPHEPLADDDIVRGDARYPVLWLPAADDEIVCSANGHSFSVPAHPKVLKMLERLNSGESCRVRDLVRAYKGTVKAGRVEFKATPQEIQAILERLYSLRAIEKER